MDEWGTADLDLGAYLRRIGVPGDADDPPPPTLETLRAVHRAHVAAIPFENLDIRLGRGVDVGLDAVQAKLVDRRRGGYCFEQNGLLGAALERLGFAVERWLARVGSHAGGPSGRAGRAGRLDARARGDRARRLGAARAQRRGLDDRLPVP